MGDGFERIRAGWTGLRATVAVMSAWFVSGASSGIGAELARQLAARGDDVALAARRVQRLEALADDLRPLGVTATVHGLDVTDAAAVDRQIRAADAAHDGLDVVVVNAGVGGGARVGHDRHEDNRHLLEVNLLGALAQTETALQLFRPRDAGQVVLMSSVAGLRALPGTMATYSASKAALRSLGRSLQADLAGSGVIVTILLPGYITSEMTEDVPEAIKTATAPAVTSIIEAVDDRRAEAYIPGWWKAVARGLLPVVPRSVLRHFG